MTEGTQHGKFQTRGMSNFLNNFKLFGKYYGACCEIESIRFPNDIIKVAIQRIKTKSFLEIRYSSSFIIYNIFIISQNVNLPFVVTHCLYN